MCDQTHVMIVNNIHKIKSDRSDVEFQKIYKFIWNLFSKDIPFPHYLCQTKALIYITRNDIIICVYEGW